jgi:hypothetical protein
MNQPDVNWNCPRCGADVDGGFEVCWACGTSRDGTSDPDFEVATAPIVEVDHVDPPATLKVLMWICLLLTVPVAISGAPVKFKHPWGTIFAILLLGGFVCAVLRLLSALLRAVRCTSKRDGTEPNCSPEQEKRQ